MYTSEFFAETDQSQIDALIARHALAMLISQTGHGFDATHAPMLFDPDHNRTVLIGHMARPNGHWRRIAAGDPVLAIFRGPDAYVTPSIYEVDPDVPTWNYSAVHIHGRWRPMTEQDELRRVLDLSIEAYERVLGTGWKMSDIPDKLVASLSRGVFAFAIEIDRIEAAQKLSQDKCLKDVQAVQRTLSQCPVDGVGAAMQRVTIDCEKYQNE